MNWKDHEETLFPSRRGGRADQAKCNVTLNSARPGRSNNCCNSVLTSPRCALFKVARHLFKGLSVPSSKEGNRPLSHILPFIHTFFTAPSPGLRGTSQNRFRPTSGRAPTGFYCDERD